jgi:acyl carrier protein phosphodiesterase
MNYLAHIHLAHATNTSMVGNFLGDFVKGNNLDSLPTELEQGVRLHRAIDTFTDQHAEVRALKQLFPSSIRRMSGVVIDVYFDHLLCRYWGQYSQAPLVGVLNSFYSTLSSTSLAPHMDPHGVFENVKRAMVKNQWLHEYSNISAIHRAFNQIEKRLGHRVIFAQESIDFVTDADHQFAKAFEQFYPQLLDYCHVKCK